MGARHSLGQNDSPTRSYRFRSRHPSGTVRDHNIVSNKSSNRLFLGDCRQASNGTDLCATVQPAGNADLPAENGRRPTRFSPRRQLLRSAMTATIGPVNVTTGYKPVAWMRAL